MLTYESMLACHSLLVGVVEITFPCTINFDFNVAVLVPLELVQCDSMCFEWNTRNEGNVFSRKMCEDFQ